MPGPQPTTPAPREPHRRAPAARHRRRLTRMRCRPPNTDARQPSARGPPDPAASIPPSQPPSKADSHDRALEELAAYVPESAASHVRSPAQRRRQIRGRALRPRTRRCRIAWKGALSVATGFRALRSLASRFFGAGLGSTCLCSVTDGPPRSAPSSWRMSGHRHTTAARPLRFGRRATSAIADWGRARRHAVCSCWPSDPLASLRSCGSCAIRGEAARRAGGDVEIARRVCGGGPASEPAGWRSPRGSRRLSFLSE
jgi:hypothetical protein